jgi:hypothetical protein
MGSMPGSLPHGFGWYRDPPDLRDLSPDETRRLPEGKGALLVRNSWGTAWGDQGYGWLPYAYVRDELAVDL